jgi:hypothetical protein
MALTMCINPIYVALPAGELNLSSFTFRTKDGTHKPFLKGHQKEIFMASIISSFLSRSY